jgi:hypothetical protein
MTKKILLLLIGVVLVGSLLYADMTLEDVVAKCIEASGGQKAYKAVNTLKITAKMHVQGMELPIIAYVKRPLMGRIEVIFQGMKIITAFNEVMGWTINPLQGETQAKKMPEDVYVRLKEGLDIDHDFIDYQQKGHTLELMGKEELDGTPVYKIKMMKKSGNLEYMFIDAEYFLVVKQISKVKRGENEFESEEIMGDYREVAGIMMAHSTETKINNKTVEQSTIEKVEVNLSLDDKLFQMPEKKTAETPKDK